MVKIWTILISLVTQIVLISHFLSLFGSQWCHLYRNTGQVLASFLLLERFELVTQFPSSFTRDKSVFVLSAIEGRGTFSLCSSIPSQSSQETFIPEGL